MKPAAMFACLIVLIFTLQNAHCACPYAHPYPYDLCGPNEELLECGTACPKTCADLNDPPKCVRYSVYRDASASLDSSESLYMGNAFRNYYESIHGAITRKSTLNDGGCNCAVRIRHAYPCRDECSRCVTTIHTSVISGNVFHRKQSKKRDEQADKEALFWR
uniref:Putative TIL domain polypeptide n=1 Tax=Anopheles gambiae TaxID=7165 RepID=Q2EPZ8_ANOGA|nr:putative TIL domain polypeptide [Anopheles gambiae]